MNEQIKLSDNQERVLMFYSKDENEYEEYSFTFNYISNSIDLDERLVRLACRALTRKGLFELNNCMDDDGCVQGRRYGVTFKGEKLIKNLINNQ